MGILLGQIRASTGATLDLGASAYTPGQSASYDVAYNRVDYGDELWIHVWRGNGSPTRIPALLPDWTPILSFDHNAGHVEWWRYDFPSPVNGNAEWAAWAPELSAAGSGEWRARAMAVRGTLTDGPLVGEFTSDVNPAGSYPPDAAIASRLTPELVNSYGFVHGMNFTPASVTVTSAPDPNGWDGGSGAGGGGFAGLGVVARHDVDSSPLDAPGLYSTTAGLDWVWVGLSVEAPTYNVWEFSNAQSEACPTVDPPTFTSPVCIPGAQLGSGEDTRVVLVDRGGRGLIADLSPTTGQFTRLLDDTSDLQMTGVIGGGLDGQPCCDTWDQVVPWRTEIMVFRDGRDAWAGPVTDVDFEYGRVLVEASDLTAWWDRRVVPDVAMVDMDVAVLFRQIHELAMAPDPVDNFVLTPLTTGTLVSRSYVASEYMYASDALGELAETGIDYTAYGRTIILGDQEIPGEAYLKFTDDFWTVPPTVSARGNEQATVVVVRGKGVSATATAPQEYIDYYGYLVRVFDEQTIETAEEAQKAAQARVDLLRDPLYIETPANASLRPTAPVTLPELIPGLRVRVETEATCRRVASDFRLDSVTVDFKGAVQVGLQPLGALR